MRGKVTAISLLRRLFLHSLSSQLDLFAETFAKMPQLRKPLGPSKSAIPIDILPTRAELDEFSQSIFALAWTLRKRSVSFAKALKLVDQRWRKLRLRQRFGQMMRVCEAELTALENKNEYLRTTAQEFANILKKASGDSADAEHATRFSAYHEDLTMGLTRLSEVPWEDFYDLLAGSSAVVTLESKLALPRPATACVRYLEFIRCRYVLDWLRRHERAVVVHDWLKEIAVDQETARKLLKEHRTRTNDTARQRRHRASRKSMSRFSPEL
jgi:hypothetical protein